MLWRIKIFCLRLLDYVVSLPLRLLHLFKWLFGITPIRGRNFFLRWLAGILVLIVDIGPFPLFYETLLDLIKWKTRPLTDREIEIARSVFGNKLPYHLIGIDPASIPAISKKTFAYVSFHTINFDQQIPDHTFIHECVHIWQYRKYGAVYITESFWAQRWGGGYNYGGRTELSKYAETLRLKAFNFEQQADIIEDYFRWKTNVPLQWMDNIASADIFIKYVEDLS